LGVVVHRAHSHDLEFPMLPVILNYCWIVFQLVVFGDLLVSYCRHYLRRKKGSARLEVRGSKFLQPRCWTCCAQCLRIELTPRSYLILLAVVLPVNALFFYEDLGRPLCTPSRLEAYDITGFLANWPSGGGLQINPATWAMSSLSGKAFDPPMRISTKECYSYGSPEFQILAKLQAEVLPKQAYCESLLGSMMVDWRKENSGNEWQHDEDIWDEAFEFSLRLFSSLAGIVADGVSGWGSNFWFLKDMTDLFDMYFLTNADVEQMHEGRPLLAKNHLIGGYSQSYHSWVYGSIWLAFFTIFARALSAVGFQPHVWLAQRWGSSAEPEQLRSAVDAFCSLFFIELPFFLLRWLAWRHYGLPVSIMAVKNVLGVYEDLYMLGILRGFAIDDGKPRGFQLCCRCCTRRRAG